MCLILIIWKQLAGFECKIGRKEKNHQKLIKLCVRLDRSVEDSKKIKNLLGLSPHEGKDNYIIPGGVVLWFISVAIKRLEITILYVVFEEENNFRRLIIVFLREGLRYGRMLVTARSPIEIIIILSWPTIVCPVCFLGEF